MNYPANLHKFSFEGEGDTKLTIKDLISFDAEFSKDVEEWKSFDNQGWTSRMVTGRDLSISCTAKRNYGEKANDAVADMAFLQGEDVVKNCEWELPNGTKITFPGVFEVTKVGGGEATAVDELEFTVYCVGMPTIVEAGA